MAVATATGSTTNCSPTTITDTAGRSSRVAWRSWRPRRRPYSPSRLTSGGWKTESSTRPSTGNRRWTLRPWPAAATGRRRPVQRTAGPIRPTATSVLPRPRPPRRRPGRISLRRRPPRRRAVISRFSAHQRVAAIRWRRRRRHRRAAGRRNRAATAPLPAKRHPTYVHRKSAATGQRRAHPAEPPDAGYRPPPRRTAAPR